MHITTHLLMANVLYKKITSKLDIELDYLSYLYGNIKPDVNPGIIDWPHFSHQSLQDLDEYCEKLITTPMSVKELSVALGVVSHFVCDYYCLYHTKSYRPKGIVKHTLHEHLLELRFIKKSVTGNITFSEQAFSEGVASTINHYLDMYHNEKHSIDKDIHYAINTSLCILERVILLSKVQIPAHLEPELGYEWLKTGTIQ